jgi:hypothetical protein
VRFILGLILGAIIGFGLALWFQGEPPFTGTAASHGGGIILTLTDGFLTRTAGPAIRSQSAGAITNVKVTSTDGDTAFVEAMAHAGPVSATVGVSFSPQASAGSVRLAVRSVHLGPLPVPGVVLDPLVNVINARIAALIGGSNYRVVGAGTTGRGVEVYLRRS